MTCTRCPSLTPITVEQAGVELCRVCADLGAEKPPAPDFSEAHAAGRSLVAEKLPGATRREPQPCQPPARPARSKR